MHDIEYMQIANGVLSMLGAACIAGLILNPRINEGIFVKAGLMAMAWGLIGNAYLALSDSQNWGALWNAGFVLRAGVVVVCAGMWWRARNADHAN